jgi:hypothetical protein
VLMMAFTLVYSAEHYVIDILLGWALAAAVMFAIGRWEERRAAMSDELEMPPEIETIADEPTDEPDAVPQGAA